MTGTAVRRPRGGAVNAKAAYRGRLLKKVAETEKAERLRIKWGNGVSEGWIPKKAIVYVSGGRVSIRSWFVEAEKGICNQKVS